MFPFWILLEEGRWRYSGENWSYKISQ